MIFPLGDDNQDRTMWPLVNVTLIAINILVFVFLQGMGDNHRFTFAYSTVPAEIVSGRDLVTPDRVVEAASVEGPVRMTVPGLQPTPIPVYLTLLTAMFMHGGLMHLAGNMWFLWIFGDNIEHDLGRWRYLAFYLACGLLASLAHVALNASGESSQVPSLGASGAISGVLGGYLLLHPHRRVTVLLLRILVNVPGYVAVGLWFLFQVVSGLGLLGGMERGVAYGAHIGGFIAGVGLVRLFQLGRPRPPRDAWRAEYAGW